MFLLCTICKHKVATIVEPTFPICGAMFESPDSWHKVPRPWSPVITWVDMYCPMCNKRAVPIPTDDTIELLTDEGVVKVGVKGILFPEAQDGPVVVDRATAPVAPSPRDDKPADAMLGTPPTAPVARPVVPAKKPVKKVS